MPEIYKPVGEGPDVCVRNTPNLLIDEVDPQPRTAFLEHTGQQQYDIARARIDSALAKIGPEIGSLALYEAIMPSAELSPTGLSASDILAIATGQTDGTLTEDDVIFLVETAQGFIVDARPDSFPPLGPRSFNVMAARERLFVHSTGKFVHTFTDLGMDEAATLLKKRRPDILMASFDSFDAIAPSDHLALARSMIDSMYVEHLFDNFEKFTGIGLSDHIILARAAVETNRLAQLLPHLNKLPGIDPKDHAELVLGSANTPSIWFIVDHLDTFTGLTDQNRIDFAHELMDANRHAYLVRNLDKFDGLRTEDLYRLADELIDKRMSDLLMTHLEEFVYFTDKDMCRYAQAAIDSGPIGVMSVGGLLGKFRGLSKDIACTLIEKDYERSVVDNLARSFAKLTPAEYTEIALRIINTNQVHIDYLVRHIDQFIGIDQRKIADTLISRGYRSSVLREYEHFTDLSVLDDVEIFESLLLDKSDYSASFCSLVGNVDKFSGLAIEDYTRAADDEIARRGVALVIEHIDKLPGLDHAHIIELARKQGLYTYVVNRASKFNVDIPLDMYASASSVMLEGFDRRWLGGFIKARLDAGLEQYVDETTTWLGRFRLTDEKYDIEAIKKIASSGGTVPETLPRRVLIDRRTEQSFFIALASSELTLRERLTYGDTRRASNGEGKLQQIFTINQGARSAYHEQLKEKQTTLTKQYYCELLTSDDTLNRWHQCEANGMKQHRFFTLLFKKHPHLKQTLDSRISTMRTELTDSFIAENQDESTGILTDSSSLAGIEWFTFPAEQLLYRTMLTRDDSGVPLYKTVDFDYTKLITAAYTLRTDRDAASMCLSPPPYIDPSSQKKSLGDVTHDLRQNYEARSRYIQDAQTWLSRHVTTNHDQLRHAWANRPLALANGVPDGAAHITQWVKEGELKVMLNELETKGQSVEQYNISREEFMSDTLAPVRNELIRVLSPIQTLEAASKLKKWREERGGSAEQIVPASKQIITIDGSKDGQKYRFEVLSKDDPRGCTIGKDTNCCMTIGGISENCIEAGYTRKDTGFVALYRGGKLIAQSFWYINPSAPHILVIDNIETNEGRNLGPIVHVYQQALKQILIENPAAGITNVNVGTRYSDVSLGELKDTIAVQSFKGVYTDAKIQKQLLSLSQIIQ